MSPGRAWAHARARPVFPVVLRFSPIGTELASPTSRGAAALGQRFFFVGWGTMKSMMAVVALTALVGLSACKKSNTSNSAQTSTSDTTTVQAPAPAVTDTVVKTTTTAVDTIHGKTADTTKAGQDTTKGAKGAKHATHKGK